jgi:hypothetical protein
MQWSVLNSSYYMPLKASILSSIHLLVTFLNVPVTKLYCEASPESLHSGRYPHILIVIMCILAFYWAIVKEEKGLCSAINFAIICLAV